MTVCRILPLWVLVLSSHAGAQEIDTALAHSSQTGRFTILDQIADPGERTAFTRLYKQTEAMKRREMALGFVERYPDSWLLGQAWEIAAKSSIDAGDLNAAVEYAAKSLRLWPENVLLLVPIAGVQAKLRMLEAAQESAKRALWCLERFDRPSSIGASEWPGLQRGLRASSYFVLGRVAATRGLAAAGAERTRHLEEADRWLLEAMKLDRSDAETLYLAGLVRSALNRPQAAAPLFGEVRRLQGGLQTAALAQLQSIYRGSEHGFESWVRTLKLELPAAETTGTARRSPSEYAGSEACASCHRHEYESWKATGMGRMFRKYQPDIVSGDFAAGAIGDEARASVDHGRHYIAIQSANHEWKRYPVEYVIGSKWQQAYATRFPDGRIQVFPIQFNLVSRQWVNYWKTIDPPGSARTDVHRFGDEVPTATYQLNCAPCHTSQLRLKGAAIDANGASFREGGINCEMCHGPAGAHVTARGKKSPADPPVDFARIGADESVAICAQCHMQSGVRAPEQDGAVNFSDQGATFYRVSQSRPYVDFSRKAFYKDGRFRVTTFIVESFMRSACFRKGGATCGSCHDPHPANPASNPVSLKFAPDNDELCLQCHGKLRGQVAAHTHHSLDSEASRCVSCHMPKIMEAVLFSARSHQIDDVPDAEMAARFGQNQSPNACLVCHQGKDANWLAGQLKKWHG
jgi:predicted CXXCH cytochrome family protein